MEGRQLAPGGPHFFDGRRLSCLYHPPSGF
jgi:hypothetical protein